MSVVAESLNAEVRWLKARIDAAETHADRRRLRLRKRALMAGLTMEDRRVRDLSKCHAVTEG